MSRRALAWVPGVILFQVMAVVSLVLGARVQYSDFRYLWQHLAPEAVAGDLLGSLLALHIQPPGFNLILAGIDRFGLQADLAWLLFGLGLASLTIALSADAVRRMTGSLWWGMGVGLVLALLPSTVLYALWPAYTILVAALVTVAAWCVVVALDNSSSSRITAIGLVSSGLAVATLFLVRASFTWLVVMAWVALLIVLAMLRLTFRMRAGAVAALLGILVVIVLVQVRSFTTFGLVTQSSWSGQNLINAGLSSGAITTADLRAAAGEDRCLGYLATRAPFTPDTPDTSVGGSRGACVDLDDSESDALSVVRWSNGQYNFNNAAELAWAPAWNTLAIRVVIADPLILPRIIAGSAQEPGSLTVLLGRSDTYNQVHGNWEAAGALLGKLWPLSVMWGPLVVAVSLLGGLAVLVIPRLRQRAPTVFWILWSSSGVLLAIDLIAEHGENQRFRVEIDPLLAIVAASALFQLVRSRSLTSGRSDLRSPAEGRAPESAT
jgi:hypothetical protein